MPVIPIAMPTATTRPCCAPHRWRTAENSAAYLLPHLRRRIGCSMSACGPGTITVDLAERLSKGWVTGIDSAETAVVATRELAAERESAGSRPRSATSTRSRHADSLRRRARASGAAAPHRPGRRRSRDASGGATGGVVARPRRRLRGLDLGARPTPASTAGSSSTTRSPGPPAANPTRPVGCDSGPSSPASAR